MSQTNNIAAQRLLQDHDFEIRCWDDDGHRLVELFRVTWERLQPTVCANIAQYWQAAQWPPLIELSNLWRPHDAYGQVTENGRRVRFRQKAFACFPKPAAQWVIAHE